MTGLAKLPRRAAGGASPSKITLRSWMGIFSAEVEAAKVGTVDELAALVRSGCYACVGAAHSYNGVQIVRDAGRPDPRRVRPEGRRLRRH